jgi:hypothetical protein
MDLGSGSRDPKEPIQDPGSGNKGKDLGTSTQHCRKDKLVDTELLLRI